MERRQNRNINRRQSRNTDRVRNSNRNRRNKKEEQIKVFIYRIAFVGLMVLACVVAIVSTNLQNKTEKKHQSKNEEITNTGNNVGEITKEIEETTESTATVIIENYAKNNGYSLEDYPESIIKLLEKNKETKNFVLNYPANKDKEFNIDLSEYKDSSTVPLFLQWDERWGYYKYAGDCIGITGCGPTCMSMVTVFLTGDTKKNPQWMADFATSNLYANDTNGSEWVLVSEGAGKLGMTATAISIDENRIRNELQSGNPIICVVGPGDFTTSGHFIVMIGYDNGMITLNDPNSKANSEKEWAYDRIASQIKNLWVITKE